MAVGLNPTVIERLFFFPSKQFTINNMIWWMSSLRYTDESSICASQMSSYYKFISPMRWWGWDMCHMKSRGKNYESKSMLKTCIFPTGNASAITLMGLNFNQSYFFLQSYDWKQMTENAILNQLPPPYFSDSVKNHIDIIKILFLHF